MKKLTRIIAFLFAAVFIVSAVPQDTMAATVKDGVYYDETGAQDPTFTGAVKVKKKFYYVKNGSVVKSVSNTEAKAWYYAQKIIDKVTDESMTKEEKLEACFNWVVDCDYYIWAPFDKSGDWTARYALYHFTEGKGECHSDAAAFAYLAAALGYKKVYVCRDAKLSKGSGVHAWTEIKGKVYDPLYYGNTSDSKYFGGSYKKTGLKAVVKTKVKMK